MKRKKAKTWLHYLPKMVPGKVFLDAIDIEMLQEALQLYVESPEQPQVDMSSWFYKNCKRHRGADAPACRECPFREYIEKQGAGQSAEG